MMGRRRVEMKKIENPTNRQVTFSKRRLGLMKKTREISVLCDAQVCLILMSSTNKVTEYCSPSTDVKKVLERYQQESGIDLWSSQCQGMLATLNQLKEVNQKLRSEMRQRKGENLDGLDMEELRGLEQSVDDALQLVRRRKYHVISTQTDTCKKKLKNIHEEHELLLNELALGFGCGDCNCAIAAEEGIQVGGTSLVGAARGLCLPMVPSRPDLRVIGCATSGDLCLS